MGVGSSMDEEHTQMRIKDAVYVLRLKDHGSVCQLGLPGGAHAGTIQCDVAKGDYPKELQGIMTKDEFTKFIEDLNAAFNKTHVPLCPCCLTLCIYGCVMQYCTFRRIAEYNKIISEANNEAFLERGYYWESMARANGANGYLDEFLAQLKVDPNAMAKRKERENGGVVSLSGIDMVSMDR